jgi:phage baseplate assembly protein V
MSSPLARWLAPLRGRVVGMIARAVVRSSNDTPKLQELELAVMGTERIPRAEHFQPYGLSSRPAAGAEAVVVFAQGNRDHPLVVVVDDRRARPTGLEDGEVMVYGPAGSRVHLKADGSIAVSTTNAGLGVASAGSVDIDAGGAITVTALGQVVTVKADSVDVIADTLQVTAATSATIASGPSSIEVTPAGVVITGAAVDINSS